MLIKQRSLSLPRNLALSTFAEWQMVSTNVNMLYLIYLADLRLCLLLLIKQKFAKNFSKSTNLDDLGIFWPAFPSSTNLKELCNTRVGEKGHNQPWFINGILSRLYFCGGCEEEWTWTFIRTSWTLFNICLKQFFLPGCWKVLPVVPIFKNVEERSG